MAQFIGSIKGKQGEAHRLGSKKSGLVCHANGWHCGITITAEHVDGEDVFHVYLNSGSAADKTGKAIGTFSRRNLDE